MPEGKMLINGMGPATKPKKHKGGCSFHSDVCRDHKMDCGFAVTGYDGHRVWKKIHKTVDTIPCDTCRHHGQSIFKFVHDFVNVGLGKRAKYPGNFHKVAQQVRCAER